MPTQGHAHAAYNLGLLLWRHDPVRILNRLANKRASSSMWPKDEAKGKQEEEEVQDTPDMHTGRYASPSLYRCRGGITVAPSGSGL